MSALYRLAVKSLGILSVLALLATQPTLAGGHCNHCNTPLKTIQTCSGCLSAEYCKRECQLADWKEHKAQCTAFKALKDAVEIRESMIPNAGLGLFTKKAFKKGEIIAVYYGDTINRTPTNSELAESPFALTRPDKSIIIGQTNPLPAPHLAAQFANDPFIDSASIQALHALDCKADNTQLVQDIATRYLKKRLAKDAPPEVEVDFESFKFPVFRANANMKAGSEVYFSYGLSYWMNRAFGICDRKGLPVQALKMVRAASEAVEKFPGLRKADFTRLYFGYLSQDGYETNLRGFTHPERELGFKITSLVTYPQYLQMQIHNPEGFAEMVKELDVLKELDEISKLDNAEFLRPDSQPVVHPRSIALLRKMVSWNINSELDPPPFVLSDVVKDSYIFGDELCQLLRLKPSDQEKDGSK